MASKSYVTFAKKNWPVLAVFGISLVVAVWFAASFVLNLIYFNDPRHQDEALKGWMTPRYVLMSYDLPRDVVAEVFELSEPGGGRLRLDGIADTLGLTLEELTERVRAAAATYRQSQP